MKRLVEKQILDWKDSPRRKPLVIRGARQVGKTWLVEKILSKRFEHSVTVDLEARRDLHKYFEGNLEPKEILKGIEFSFGRIEPGRTLLFLDEIQACPRAIMALRYFYEKLPELHLVSAGSLLEFAFGKISVPVGRIQYLNVYPMTFYEYLLAIGNKLMAEQVFSYTKNLSEALQQAILNELKNYFFVGGMPEAVKLYADTESFLAVFDVQTEIIDSYIEDFSKYTPRVDITCLNEVFLSAARSIGEQLKYTRLSTSHSYQTNHKAFDLLVKARVLHKIPSCDPSGLPLGATADSRKFKSCILDIGLLQRLCQIPVEMEISRKNLINIYRGRLAEQFVAQELIAWHSAGLFYWSRNAKSSNAEIDYLTVKNGHIHPIEVKSGPSGKLRSLHLMLQLYPNCPRGLVLYSGIHKDLPEQKLTFMPLYATSAIGDKNQVRM